ncbi:hypothetical protein BO71DRAFT_117303 [Aspergillus ellipticus CBS 707.79]|uniref:Uncharacterized protein n=1 Tax=Aspergillus ellipticus CBS 707.79 TaxID=1448320 RepID=A0A319CWW8_9EURO|nr:hypothetical protein BO71DRAFT_117303 [Aspergillus ellipticus CBS 707.79]
MRLCASPVSTYALELSLDRRWDSSRDVPKSEKKNRKKSVSATDSAQRASAWSNYSIWISDCYENVFLLYRWGFWSSMFFYLKKLLSAFSTASAELRWFRICFALFPSIMSGLMGWCVVFIWRPIIDLGMCFLSLLLFIGSHFRRVPKDLTGKASVDS